jgi:hypothetical protein
VARSFCKIKQATEVCRTEIAGTNIVAYGRDRNCTWDFRGVEPFTPAVFFARGVWLRAGGSSFRRVELVFLVFPPMMTVVSKAGLARERRVALWARARAGKVLPGVAAEAW